MTPTIIINTPYASKRICFELSFFSSFLLLSVHFIHFQAFDTFFVREIDVLWHLLELTCFVSAATAAAAAVSFPFFLYLPASLCIVYDDYTIRRVWRRRRRRTEELENNNDNNYIGKNVLLFYYHVRGVGMSIFVYFEKSALKKNLCLCTDYCLRMECLKKLYGSNE